MKEKTGFVVKFVTKPGIDTWVPQTRSILSIPLRSLRRASRATAPPLVTRVTSAASLTTLSSPPPLLLEKDAEVEALNVTAVTEVLDTSLAAEVEVVGVESVVASEVVAVTEVGVSRGFPPTSIRLLRRPTCRDKVRFLHGRSLEVQVQLSEVW